MSDELKIMLKSHEYLRQEILNSIGWQNRFVIAEVTVISALLGLGLTEQPLKFLLTAIPPAVIALTAFWLIEQSRMMRAGDYLQLLEDEINIKAEGAYILWENWLRLGMAGGVHTIHHISQYLGVFGVFYVVSGISIWKTITLGLLPCWAWVLYIAMLVILLVPICLVIPHRATERKEFKCWRQVYWEERAKKDITSDELKQKIKESLKRTSQKQE